MKTTLRLLWMATTTLVNAWVMQTLWHWFLEPTPIGFPTISFVHALGICTLVDFLINTNSTTTIAVLEHEEEDILKHSLVHCATLWTLTMGIASLAHWGMP